MISAQHGCVFSNASASMLLFFAWLAYSACAIARSLDVFELIDQSGGWANFADLRFSRTQSCTVLSGILIAAGQQPRAHLLSTRHTVARLYVSSKRALPAHTLDRPPFPRITGKPVGAPFQRATAPQRYRESRLPQNRNIHRSRRRRYHFTADSGKRKPLSARMPCWLAFHWRPHHIRLGTHRSPGHANRLRTRFSDSDRTRSIVLLGLP
jgi:hypothetical protein